MAALLRAPLRLALNNDRFMQKRYRSRGCSAAARIPRLDTKL